MKQTILFSLLLLISSCKKEEAIIQENIQTPTPPAFLCPESDAYWITYSCISAWPEGNIFTNNKYGIGKDTIINGTTYSTLTKETIYVYDYDDMRPNDTIICRGIGSIYRQDKVSREIFYPHIQNCYFHYENLFFDFSVDVGDTLYSEGDNWVVVYETDSITLGGESLKRIRWESYSSIFWPNLDSGVTLQAYYMPLDLPSETCDCDMQGNPTKPIFILNGDTIEFSDFQ